MTGFLASTDLKVYSHLDVTGRSIQRMAAVIGPEVQAWMQTREPTKPDPSPAVMHVSYDGTGVPTTKAETQGRKGKQPDGTSKSREETLLRGMACAKKVVVLGNLFDDYRESRKVA